MSSFSAHDIQAGRAYVEIGTRDSALVAGLAKAARQIQSFGKSIQGFGLQAAGLGTSIFGPLAGAGAAFAEHGNALEENSKKTGISVSDLSTLGYAAQQSGVDMDSLTLAVSKMGRTLVEAERGGGQAQKALYALGLTLNDISGQTPDQRFKLIADAISKVQDPSVRAADAMAIFGRNGAQLLPLLLQGAGGIDALQQRARDLGLQWSGTDARNASIFKQSLRDLWDVMSHGTDIIGASVAPVLGGLVNISIRAIVATTAWANAHRTLFGIIAGGSAAFLALSLGIVTLGTAVNIVGIALGTAASGIGIVVTGFAALLSPLGGIVVAIGAGVAALLYFSNAGNLIAGALKDAFGQVAQIFEFVFSHATSLTQAWVDASQIAFSAIQSALTIAVSDMKELWSEFENWMGLMWDRIGINAIRSIGEMVGFLQKFLDYAHIPNAGDSRTQALLTDEQTKILADEVRLKAIHAQPASVTDELALLKAAIAKAESDIDAKTPAGGKSLKDHLDALLTPLTNIKLPDFQNNADLTEALRGQGERTFGTFNAAAVAENVGGSTENVPAKETANAATQMLMLFNRLMSAIDSGKLGSVFD
jgi:hypothetical protein